MADLEVIEERAMPRIRGREPRAINLSTKLTAAEAQSIEGAATVAGKTPSEWARDALLRAAGDQSRAQMQMHIFTELVAIQMLLMSTLEPLLRGDKLGPDQLAALFRHVQTTKAAKAQELLLKRSQNREK
jgi:hypothetical protein